MNSIDHWLDQVTMLDATDEDVDNFGAWLQENGEDYWNGKCYDLGEYCMVPIYFAGVDRIVGYSLELKKYWEQRSGNAEKGLRIKVKERPRIPGQIRKRPRQKRNLSGKTELEIKKGADE